MRHDSLIVLERLRPGPGPLRRDSVSLACRSFRVISDDIGHICKKTLGGGEVYRPETV